MKMVLTLLTLLMCMSPLLAVGTDSPAECEMKVKMAQAAKIIRGLSVKPNGVHVIVDADTWAESSYYTKLGLAASVECAIVNPGEKLSAVILHDHRTNKIVGRYRYPELVVQ